MIMDKSSISLINFEDQINMLITLTDAQNISFIVNDTDFKDL